MRHFFYLQKSDRKAMIFLLLVIVAACVVFYIAGGREEESHALQPVEKPEHSLKSYRKQAYKRHDRQQPKAERFYFDPNTADPDELARLGLRPWQIKNLEHYREAGGVFRRPRDFARLYGMTAKQYRELEPYIRIDQDEIEEHMFYAYEPIEMRDTVKYPIKMTSEERIVLNTADTVALRKVPGVGPHFARKIVEYRERLGGYYRVQQLLEIDDFPESAVAFFIIPDDSTLRKMNINRLSLNELKRHPYINFFQAREIIDYRRLHGRINHLHDLSLSRDFPPEAIERLEPYVEY